MACPTRADIAIVLENGSGGGFGMGTTIEELAAIDRAVRDAGVPPARLGFCLDAAHLWGAGYPIDTAAGVDEVLAAFDEQIGLDRLVMVHLNDSRSERGSRADRHEHVGAGRIGGEGLARLLSHPEAGARRLHPRDARHGRALRRDQPCPRAGARRRAGRSTTLPPAAFQLRSARGRSAPPDPDVSAP